MCKYNKSVYNPGKDTKVPSKDTKQNWTGPEISNICFCIISISSFIERALDAICSLDFETLFSLLLDLKFQILEATRK